MINPVISIVKSRINKNYYVSRDGRIFKFKKNVLFEIKLQNSQGYMKFGSWKNGKRCWVGVHRFVAFEFCENFKNGYVVNHIDNNPLNNNYQNLEWCSQKENIQHRNNQNRTARGCASGKSKLSDFDVLQIRSSKEKSTKLAKIYGVNRRTIDRARNKTTWNKL